ncbi:SHOCT domain-containing protein [Mucilaginibacter sp.]|uniref:SHOCT domain-containing protein n=1 Tax=Mucilaginibacter sp. TaxID=1882438 RepID=UPI003564F52C
MNWIWWTVWFILLVWVFATPYNIPGQRHAKENALEILKRRFANGEIDHKEYEERKAVIEKK